MDLSAGTRIDDRYTVRGLLGTGGMARVYVAHDDRLGIDCAVKVLSVPSAAIGERLRQEGRVQAALKHPNVLGVTDIITVAGCPGLVMELVDGAALDTVLRGIDLTADEALQLARDAIEGVAAAHALGLVHRDLKPANILVAVAGDRLVPKVADFGLAKLLGDQTSGTRSGAAMGTPRYMAPEQVRDAKSVDARADLFSLGAILYELFTGRTAFQGADTFELFDAVVKGRHAPLDDLPAGVDDAVAACLSVDPQDRPADCAAVLAMLPTPTSTGFRPEVVAAVGAMAVGPRSAPSLGSAPVSDPTWTEEGPTDPGVDAAATFLADDIDIEPSIAPDPPSPAPAPPASRARWPLAVMGLVIVAVVVFLGWPSQTHQFGEQAPRVDDPALQARLDRAYSAYLASEDKVAIRELDTALAAGTDEPAFHLLRAALALGEGSPVAFERFVQDGAALDGDGAVGALLATMNAGNQEREDLSWMADRMPAHLEAWPDDRLAPTIWALGTWLTGEPDQALLDRIEGDLPHAVLPVMLRVYMQMEGDPAAAMQSAQAGLEGHPSSAPLRAALAETHLAQADCDAAYREASHALQLDAAWVGARITAIVCAARLGKTEDLARLSAPLLGPEASDDDVLLAATTVAVSLENLGQHRDAAPWMDRARRAAEARDDPGQLLHGYALRVMHQLSPWLADATDLESRVTALDRNVADPRMSAQFRSAAGKVSVLGHAIVDVYGRRSADAARILERDDLTAPQKEVLQNLIWWEEGRTGALTQTTDSTCRNATLRGALLVDLGLLEEGERAFDRASDDASCTGDLQVQAMLAAGRAHIAAAEGNRKEAAAHVERFRQVWPNPDPDVPMVLALAGDVAPTLLAPGSLDVLLGDLETPMLVGLTPLQAHGQATPGLVAGLDNQVERLLTGRSRVRTVALNSEDADAARLAGVNHIVSGRASQLGDHLLLNLVRTDVQSGDPTAVTLEASSVEELVAGLEGGLAVLLLRPARPTRVAVRRAIRPVLSDLRDCYQATLDRDPTAGGTVRLKWTLTPAGTPVDIVVEEDSIGDPAMVDCLREHVGAVLFPAATGEGLRVITYPFTFSPG